VETDAADGNPQRTRFPQRLEKASQTALGLFTVPTGSTAKITSKLIFDIHRGMGPNEKIKRGQIKLTEPI